MSAAPDPHQVRLRLYVEADLGQTDHLSPATTFSQFYSQYFRPICLIGRRAKKTIADYDAAVALFVLLVGDPPLGKLDTLTCKMFVDLAAETPGKRRGTKRSPATIRKQAIYLQTILNTAGPQTKQNPDAPAAKGLFGRDGQGDLRPVPFFRRPDLADGDEPKGCYELAEVEAWIAACRTARKPNPAAARWHETLIRCLWNTDLRIGTALALQRQWVQRLEAGDAVAKIPKRSYKQGCRKKGPILVYLSPAALAAIDGAPGSDCCWHWPHSIEHLHAIRREIQTAAGISAERKAFGFHGLRRAGLTELYLRDPEAARLQAGHRDLTTTVGHYVQAKVLGESLARQVRAAHADLPQPIVGPRQLLLF